MAGQPATAWRQLPQGEDLAPLAADPELGSQGWQVPRQHQRRLVFRAAGALLVLGVVAALLLASRGVPSRATVASHAEIVVLDSEAAHPSDPHSDSTLLMAKKLANAAAALPEGEPEGEDTDHLPEGEELKDLPEGEHVEDDLPEGVDIDDHLPEGEEVPTSAPNSSTTGADDLPEGGDEDHLPEGEESPTPAPSASRHGADDLPEGDGEDHLPEGEELPTPAPTASRHGGNDLPEGDGEDHLPEGEESPTPAPNSSTPVADDLPEGDNEDHLPEGEEAPTPAPNASKPDADDLPEGEDEDHLPEGEETETTPPSPTPSPEAKLCPPGAEFHISYCYKSCANLTQGRYPYRLNSITCCKNDTDCSVEGMVNPDFGELVSPRESNGCLPDEEFVSGLCYKACTLITDGDYPYRMDARTCCKKSGYWSCRWPQNRKRSQHFDIGGGGGCTADAELRGHVCYKKCALLTDGEYPKRKGPSTCCKKRDCHWPGNFQTSHRFNVGGDVGCPEDEELHASRCYKRCSLLTNGTYPTRVAVATCCKERNARRCGLHNTLWTDLRFGEGSHPSNQPVHVPAGKPGR